MIQYAFNFQYAIRLNKKMILAPEISTGLAEFVLFDNSVKSYNHHNKIVFASDYLSLTPGLSLKRFNEVGGGLSVFIKYQGLLGSKNHFSLIDKNKGFMFGLLIEILNDNDGVKHRPIHPSSNSIENTPQWGEHKYW